MNRLIVTFAILGTVTLTAAADDKKPSRSKRVPPPLKKTADELPEGMHRFNGMLVGRLAKKDVEKGTFIVNVDAVPRVWRNSKAENPKSILGKSVEIDGVFGKWLDVLLVVKEGETLEFEARHDNGNRLTFPGELLRKAAPFKPEDYPVLPEEFRGFHGAVAAKIVKKDPETFEMIVHVDRVIDTWKKSRAEKSKSIEGKSMLLAGFWQRKEQYHGLKVGDRIEFGLQHISIRSDHVSVAEFVRKVGKDSEPSRPRKRDAQAGIEGFGGVIVGRLVKKDVEKGSFAVEVDAVPRVWPNNKSRNPKAIIGETVEVDGVFGRFLDVLLLAKEGETLQFEARHNRGKRLTFPGELFLKVAAVKPGDYPELPEDFRGFSGYVVAKITKKSDEMLELTLEVEKAKGNQKNRAEKPESIVGKKVMVTGFWKKKDAYHKLKVGDTLECQLQHTQRYTDNLNAVEFRKVAKTEDSDQ